MGGWGTRRKAGWLPGLLLALAAMPAFSQEPAKERSHQERFANPRTLREREERKATQRLRRNPNDAQALEDRGVARIRLGRGAEAVADLERAAKLQPKSANVRANLAYGLMQLGRWREALAATRTALALNPNHVAANAYTGHLLLQFGGDLSEAITCLERAATRAPDDVEVRIDLLNAHLQGHDLGRAGVDLRVLRMLLPGTDARLLFEDGLLRADQGNLETAINRFQRALAADPKHEGARRSLGLALAQAGRWKEALQMLDPLSQANPASFPVAYFHALALHNDQRRGAEAEARRALALRPDSPEAQLLLGVILAATGKHQEAIPLLRRVHELNPANPDPAFALGRALAETGAVEESLKVLREAVQQGPESAEAHFALADALRRSGQTKEADQETRLAESLRQKETAPVSEEPK